MTVTQMNAIAESITDELNSTAKRNMEIRKQSPEYNIFVEDTKNTETYLAAVQCEEAAQRYLPHAIRLAELRLEVSNNNRYFNCFGTSMDCTSPELSEAYLKAEVNREYTVRLVAKDIVYREVLVAEPSCESVEEIMRTVTNKLSR